MIELSLPKKLAKHAVGGRIVFLIRCTWHERMIEDKMVCSRFMESDAGE